MVGHCQFFAHYAEPILEDGKKIYVIISDALRYEIADELMMRLRQEDRYNAQLESMVGVLPSYTQLGMAALLPHKELWINADDGATVSADGKSTQGLSNRSKILATVPGKKLTAVKAEDLTGMGKEECRALIRDHDAVYVYHNRIDSVGDDRDTEGQLGIAAENAIAELIAVIKKLANANANNILLTADHGFIYQHRELADSDYSCADAAGQEILYRNRRFVIGRDLHDQPGLSKFTSTALGLSGGLEIQVPKSINRLRVKGAGSRYVHGGASLQEIVVPVLKINKKRQSDISFVDVDIISDVKVITAGQLAIKFYQRDPVGGKMLPRKFRVGLYATDDKPISDLQYVTCDLSSETPRDREINCRLILTRNAEAFNGQEIYLKLDEQEDGTSHYRTYKMQKFLLRRTFTSDFDF